MSSMEWISIKERLPETGRKILCCNAKSVFHAFYTKGDEISLNDFDNEDGVLQEEQTGPFLQKGWYKIGLDNSSYEKVYVKYWMQIPEPPRN